MCTNMCKTKYIHVSSFESFICKINQRVLIDIRQTIVNIVETDRISPNLEIYHIILI